MHEEVLHPRTMVSWPLEIEGIVDESEEAVHRSLSTHEPHNPEEEETDPFLKMWVQRTEQRTENRAENRKKKKPGILGPALPQGKEWLCACHLLRMSSSPHLRVANVSAASSSSSRTYLQPETWGVPPFCMELDMLALMLSQQRTEQ